MSRAKAVCVVLLVVYSRSALCEETQKTVRVEQAPPVLLTGNLRVDFFGQAEMRDGPRFDEKSETLANTSRKSVWLAAGLSLVLPGAGEFYAESYWKSVAFFAAEVAAWVVAYVHDKKGDRQTDAFQNFADQHWDVFRYAEYAEVNLAPSTENFNWRKPGTEGRPPWERVDWAELNRMERAIGATGPGRYYSHTLPMYGDQQYYELIGKYQQYNQGWSDALPQYLYGDPVTPNFQFYSGEREKANDFYSIATTAATIALLNHVLSAVDAAWSVSTYNSVHAQVGMRTTPGPHGPTMGPLLTVQYSF